MMLNNAQVGDLVEARTLADLIRLGYQVARPCNSTSRWDYGIVLGTRLIRIQVKSAKLLGDVVIFATCNSRKGTYFTYHGDCEFLVAYCLETNACYAVRPEDAPHKSMSLRLKPTKKRLTSGMNRGCQKQGINMAENYLLGDVLARFIENQYTDADSTVPGRQKAKLTVAV